MEECVMQLATEQARCLGRALSGHMALAKTFQAGLHLHGMLQSLLPAEVHKVQAILQEVTLLAKQADFLA